MWKLLYKNTKCTFLTADNKIVHECSKVSCNIYFQNKNNYIKTKN